MRLWSAYGVPGHVLEMRGEELVWAIPGQLECELDELPALRNNVPQTGACKQQKCVLSLLCRPDV